MLVPFIAGMLVAAVGILFAVQNSAVASVTFLWWTFQRPLSLVLCLTFLAGALASLLGLLPELLKRGWRPWRGGKKAEESKGREGGGEG